MAVNELFATRSGLRHSTPRCPARIRWAPRWRRSSRYLERRAVAPLALSRAAALRRLKPSIGQVKT